MTTTPDYIRKCEMAEEIQAMRAPSNRESVVGGYKIEYPLEQGDWFAVYGNDKWGALVYGDTIYRPEVYYRDGLDAKYFCGFIGYDEGGSADDTEKIIWLPRLDQLLDLLSGVEISPREVTGIFSSDREEILLTVIMRNKFGKRWNGEKWVAV